MDQIAREIDADGNGEIDFEEFLSIMKSDLLRWDDSQRASLEGRKMHLANFCEKLHQISLREMQLVDDREIHTIRLV